MGGHLWWAEGPPDGMNTNVDWSLLAGAAPLAMEEEAAAAAKGEGVAGVSGRGPSQSECILRLRSSSAWARSQLGGGARSGRRSTLADFEHFHIKSRQPLSPSCGVVYMECQILQVSERAVGGGGDAARQEAESSNASAAPALIIGICRKSLPLHKLPGEEAHGIGLSTRQRMVYSNSNNQAERIAMPLQGPPPLAAQLGNDGNNNNNNSSNEYATSSVSASRALTAGDAVGCLVNFLYGTVGFTVNGRLLSYCGKLDHTAAKTGYYMALGLQGSGPALRLRVIFRVGNAASGGSKSCSNTSTSRTEGAHEGLATLFDLDDYCRRFAVSFIHHTDRRMFRASWAEPHLDDAAVTMLLREYLAARGLTATLRALDHETRQLMSLAPAHTRRANEAEAYRRSQLAHSQVLAEARRRIYGSADAPYDIATTTTTGAARREEDGCSSVLHHLRQHGVLAPHLRQALAEVLGGGSAGACDTDEEGSRAAAAMHTAHFFAQRQDVLYVLSALECIERGLAQLDRRLAALQQQEEQEQERGSGEGKAAQSLCGADGWQAQSCLLHFTQHVLQPFAALRAAGTHGGRLRVVLSQLARQPGAEGLTEAAKGVSDEASAKQPRALSTAPTLYDALDSTTSSEDGETPKTSDVLRDRFLALAQTHQLRSLTPGNTNSVAATTNRTKVASATTTTTAAATHECRRRAARAQFVERATAVLFQAATPLIAAPTRQAQLALAQSLDTVCDRVLAFAQMLLLSFSSSSSPAARAAAVDERTTARAWLGYWRLLLRGARRQYTRHAWTLLCHALEDCNRQVAKLLRECLAKRGARDGAGSAARAVREAKAARTGCTANTTTTTATSAAAITDASDTLCKEPSRNSAAADERSADAGNRKSAVNTPLRASGGTEQGAQAAVQAAHAMPGPETESEEGQSETATTTQSHDEEAEVQAARHAAEEASNAAKKYNKDAGDTLFAKLAGANAARAGSRGKAAGQQERRVRPRPPRTILEAYFTGGTEEDEVGDDEVSEGRAGATEEAAPRCVSCGLQLLPPMALTLRSLWRRTHAVAVLEPLPRLVANAFIDEIQKLSALPAQGGILDDICEADRPDAASLLSPLKKERREEATSEARNATLLPPSPLPARGSAVVSSPLPDVAMSEACRIEEFRTTAAYLGRIYKCLRA